MQAKSGSNSKLHNLASIFKKKKVLVIAAIVVVIVLVAAYFIFASQKKASSNYVTGTVTKGTVTNSISASGTIEPVSTVDLGFKTSAIINKINVKVGDRVTTGELLAEQDTANLQASVTQSSSNLKQAQAKLQTLKKGATKEQIVQDEANLTMAQASYDQAKTTLDQDQQLLQAGAISQSTYDSANYALINAQAKLKQSKASLQTTLLGNTAEDIASAEAAVESSESQLESSQTDLAGAKLYSTINGVVSTINGAEGQQATANNDTTSGGGTISVISDDLEVSAQINETDIGNLKVGQVAEFTVNAYNNKTFTGKVSSIAPEATTVSNVQIYTTVISVDKNQTSLKAGMAANITIVVSRAKDVLTVPKGAVTYAATYVSTAKQSTASTKKTAVKQTTVIVLDNGKPVSEQVVLGLSDLNNYEVKSGLKAGETVILGVLTTSTTSSTSSSSSSSSSSSTSSSPLTTTGGGPGGP